MIIIQYYIKRNSVIIASLRRCDCQRATDVAVVKDSDATVIKGIILKPLRQRYFGILMHASIADACEKHTFCILEIFPEFWNSEIRGFYWNSGFFQNFTVISRIFEDLKMVGLLISRACGAPKIAVLPLEITIFLVKIPFNLQFRKGGF